MSIIVPSFLLLLTPLIAVVVAALLVGYSGLLLVRYVFRSLQHSAPPVVPPQPAPRPVQTLRQAPPVRSTAVLAVLGLIVGIGLVRMLSYSVVPPNPPQPIPVVENSVVPVQPLPQLIPVQADPVEVVPAAGAQSPQPAVSNRPQLLEVASQLGQFFQSQLQRTADSANSQTQATDGSGEAAGAAGESADGDVVVYQFSEQMLSDLFGSDAIDTLRSISHQMPPGIRNSYALIPLPGSVGATVPPMKPLLASSGLRSLADSLVQLLKTAPSDGQNVLQDSEKSLENQQPEIPAWVRQPAAGRRVARAEIFPGEDSVEKVRESVEELLQQELHSSADWIPTQLRMAAIRSSVRVAADSVGQLTQNQFQRLETLEQPIDGVQELQVIWTEIELPKAELVGQLSVAAGQNRSWLIAAGVLVCWLGLVLAAISIRLWAASGMVLKTIAAGSAVMSIGLLVAVVLVPLQSARSVTHSNGQAFNGAVVWSKIGGDFRVSL